MEKFLALLGKRLPLPLATRVTKYVSFELEGFCSALVPAAAHSSAHEGDTIGRNPLRDDTSPGAPPGISSGPLSTASSEERNLLELVVKTPELLAGGATASGAHAGDHRFDPRGFYLLCWKEKTSTTPKFKIPLADGRLVNNITEQGPCVYIIASNGEYEFQCSEPRICNLWLDTLQQLGCRLLKFTDLYRLTDFIGEGSFAKVYIGVHLFTGEKVVVKAINKKKVLESNVYTEIEVLRKVLHPYILRLYAAYEQEDYVCLVLEYLRGGELFDYLSEKGPVTEDQARHCMRRLLLALQCLHSKGVVHRDLKTENLILEAPDNPTTLKLIDFGLASTLGSPSMRMRCGSPGYVAPEILQDLPYGTKVDVFSAGIILYTLIAGFTPFRGSNVKEILKKNLRCQLNFTHHRWTNVTHSLKDLVAWMCCRNPEKRCAASAALTHPWFHRVQKPLPPPLSSATASSPFCPQSSDSSCANRALSSERGSVSTGPESTVQSHRTKEGDLHVGRRKSGREVGRQEASQVDPAPSLAVSSWRDRGLQPPSAPLQEKRTDGETVSPLPSRGDSDPSAATQPSLYERHPSGGHRAFSVSQARAGRPPGSVTRDSGEGQGLPSLLPPQSVEECKRKGELRTGDSCVGKDQAYLARPQRRGRAAFASGVEAEGTHKSQRGNELCSSLEQLPSSVENQPTVRDSCQARPSPRRTMDQGGSLRNGEVSTHAEDLSIRESVATALPTRHDAVQQAPSSSNHTERPSASSPHADFPPVSSPVCNASTGRPDQYVSRRSSFASCSESGPCSSSSSSPGSPLSAAASSSTSGSADGSSSHKEAPLQRDDEDTRRTEIRPPVSALRDEASENERRTPDNRSTSSRVEADNLSPASTPDPALSRGIGDPQEGDDERGCNEDSRDRGETSTFFSYRSFESSEHQGGMNGEEADRKPPASHTSPLSSSLQAPHPDREQPAEFVVEKGGMPEGVATGGKQGVGKRKSHSSCASSTTAGVSIAALPLTPALAPGLDFAPQVFSPLWETRNEAAEKTTDLGREEDREETKYAQPKADVPPEGGAISGNIQGMDGRERPEEAEGTLASFFGGLGTRGEGERTGGADQRDDTVEGESEDKVPVSSYQRRTEERDGHHASTVAANTEPQTGEEFESAVAGGGDLGMTEGQNERRGDNSADQGAVAVSFAFDTSSCPPDSQHAPSVPAPLLERQDDEGSSHCTIPSSLPLSSSGRALCELHAGKVHTGGNFVCDASAGTSGALAPVALPASPQHVETEEVNGLAIHPDHFDSFYSSVVLNSTAENSPTGPRGGDIATESKGDTEGLATDLGVKRGESETWLALSQQVDIFRPLASAGSECQMHDSCAFEHLPSLLPNTLLRSFFMPHAEASLNRSSTSFDHTSMNPELFLPYRKGESVDLSAQRYPPFVAEGDEQGREERFYQLLRQHLSVPRQGGPGPGGGDGREGEPRGELSPPSVPLDDRPLLQFLRTPQGAARFESFLLERNQIDGSAPDRQPLASSPLPLSTFSVHDTSVNPFAGADETSGGSATRQASRGAGPDEGEESGRNESSTQGCNTRIGDGLNFLCSASQGVPMHALSSPPFQVVPPFHPRVASAGAEGLRQDCQDIEATGAAAPRREIAVEEVAKQSRAGVVLRSPHHGEDGTKTSQLGVAFGSLGPMSVETGCSPLGERDGTGLTDSATGPPEGPQANPEDSSQFGDQREKDAFDLGGNDSVTCDDGALSSEARQEAEMSSVVGDSSFLAACATGRIKDSRKPKRGAHGCTAGQESPDTLDAGGRRRAPGNEAGVQGREDSATGAETVRRNPSLRHSPPLPPSSPHAHLDRTVSEGRPGRSWLWRRFASEPSSPAQRTTVGQASPISAATSPSQPPGSSGLAPDSGRIPADKTEQISTGKDVAPPLAHGESASLQGMSNSAVSLSLKAPAASLTGGNESDHGEGRAKLNENRGARDSGGTETSELHHDFLSGGDRKGSSMAGPGEQIRVRSQAACTTGTALGESEATPGGGGTRDNGDSGRLLATAIQSMNDASGAGKSIKFSWKDAAPAKCRGEEDSALIDLTYVPSTRGSRGGSVSCHLRQGANSARSVSVGVGDKRRNEDVDKVEEGTGTGETQVSLKSLVSEGKGRAPMGEPLAGKRLTTENGATEKTLASMAGEGQRERPSLPGRKTDFSIVSHPSFPAPQGPTQSLFRPSFLHWHHRHLVASAMSPSLAKRAPRTGSASGELVCEASSETPKAAGDRGLVSQASQERSDKREEPEALKEGRVESGLAFATCLAGGRKSREGKESLSRRCRRDRRGTSSHQGSSSHCGSVADSACSHRSEKDEREHAVDNRRASFLDTDDRRCSCFSSQRSSVCSATILSRRRKRSTAASLWANLTGSSSTVSHTAEREVAATRSRSAGRTRSYAFRWRFSFVATWSSSRVQSSHYAGSDGSSASLADLPPLPSAAGASAAFAASGQGRNDAHVALGLSDEGAKERKKQGSRRSSEKSRRHGGFLDMMRGSRATKKEKNRNKHSREEATGPRVASDQDVVAGSGCDAGQVHSLPGQLAEQLVAEGEVPILDEHRERRRTDETQHSEAQAARTISGSSCSNSNSGKAAEVPARGESMLSSGDRSVTCASSVQALSGDRRRSNDSASCVSEILDDRASSISRASRQQTSGGPSEAGAWKGARGNPTGPYKESTDGGRRASIATVYSHAENSACRSTDKTTNSRDLRRRHSVIHTDADATETHNTAHANSFHGRLGDFLSSSSIFARLASAVGAREWITGKRRTQECEETDDGAGGVKAAREERRRSSRKDGVKDREKATKRRSGKRDSVKRESEQRDNYRQRVGSLGSDVTSLQRRGSTASENTCDEDRSSLAETKTERRKEPTLWEDWYDGEAFFQDAHDAWGPEEEAEALLGRASGSRQEAQLIKEPTNACAAENAASPPVPVKPRLVNVDGKNAPVRRQSTATTADGFSSSSCSSDFTYVEGLEYARRERGSFFLWSSCVSSSFSYATQESGGHRRQSTMETPGGLPSEKAFRILASPAAAHADEVLERKRKGEEAVQASRGRRLASVVNHPEREVEVRRSDAPRLVQEKLHGTSFLSFFDDSEDVERETHASAQPRNRKRRTGSPPTVTSRRRSGEGSERLRSNARDADAPKWRDRRVKNIRERTRCKRYSVMHAEDEPNNKL
ncbi:UNVERIFIED_CONTAM: CAM kinase, SNF1 family [Hammondia hammondi]|eukprot:XP_008883430.1 CAM kinase, SNF1 family [Hammondia hammondi]